jgi:hypothetical protein
MTHSRRRASSAPKHKRPALAGQGLDEAEETRLTKKTRLTVTSPAPNATVTQPIPAPSSSNAEPVTGPTRNTVSIEPISSPAPDAVVNQPTTNASSVVTTEPTTSPAPIAAVNQPSPALSIPSTTVNQPNITAPNAAGNQPITNAPMAVDAQPDTVNPTDTLTAPGATNQPPTASPAINTADSEAPFNAVVTSPAPNAAPNIDQGVNEVQDPTVNIQPLMVFNNVGCGESNDSQQSQNPATAVVHLSHPGHSVCKGRRSNRRARGEVASLLRNVSTTSKTAGHTSLTGSAGELAAECLTWRQQTSQKVQHGVVLLLSGTSGCS